MIGGVFNNHEKNKLKEYIISQQMTDGIEKVKASMDKHYNLIVALYDAVRETVIEININDSGWSIQCYDIEWNKSQYNKEQLLEFVNSVDAFAVFVGTSADEFKTKYEEVVVRGEEMQKPPRMTTIVSEQSSVSEERCECLPSFVKNTSSGCSCCGDSSTKPEGEVIIAKTSSNNKRVDKDNYYLNIAETVGERGTCLRRNYGSIIVKNDEIIATGYTGAPRGRKNCSDLGYCRREQMNVPRGTHYELCRSVHSEANACLSASRRDMIGATLYLVGKTVKTGQLVENANSCSMCKRLIINAGIEKVVIRDTKENYRVIMVQEWIDNDDSLDENIGY